MANDSNTTSEFRNFGKELDLSYIIPYCILFPVICTVGIVGNVLTLFIVREKKKVASLYFIMCLAIADLLVLVTRMLFVIYRIFQHYLALPTLAVSKHIPSYILVLIYVYFTRISNCILIAMVIERVIAVWLPMKVHLISTKRKAAITLIVVVVVVTALNIPPIVDAFITHIEAVRKGGKVFAGKMATLMEINRHKTLMPESINLLDRLNRILLDYTPTLLILWSNITIVVGLRYSMQKIKRIASESQDDFTKQRQKQSKQITKMLFGVSCAFLVLCSPRFFLFLFEYNANPWIHVMFNVLSTTNYAINFLFYGTINASYRRRYIELLSCTENENDERRQGQSSGHIQNRVIHRHESTNVSMTSESSRF